MKNMINIRRNRLNLLKVMPPRSFFIGETYFIPFYYTSAQIFSQENRAVKNALKLLTGGQVSRFILFSSGYILVVFL